MAKPIPLGITVAQYEVKLQERPFSLKHLYLMLNEWFIEKQYVESDKDPDFPEIMYYEARGQEHGKEVWVKWRFKHAPQHNKFYRLLLNVDLHGLGLTTVEVVQDNRKFKMEKGEFWVSCQAILEVDYENKWRNHQLLRHFLTTFWKRFIWKDLETHRHHLLMDAYELQNLVKEFLEIKRPIAHTKPYFAPRGLKTQIE